VHYLGVKTKNISIYLKLLILVRWCLLHKPQLSAGVVLFFFVRISAGVVQSAVI